MTQAFNTTTSMGRLTLNVLLSFAQFEREVTSERIRDKLAASRKKGMWMGGVPPLGYGLPTDPTIRSLTVNLDEADRVRRIFELYLELGSVSALEAKLASEGWRTRERTSAKGRTSGGVLFSRGALFHLLKNRIYLGEIVHSAGAAIGSHPAIIDPDVFDRAQALLRMNSAARSDRPLRSADLPLKGLLKDADGNPMSPSFGYGRGGRVYRYYVSAPLQQGRSISVDRNAIRRVKAEAIHDVIEGSLRAVLNKGAAPLANLLAPVLRIDVLPDEVRVTFHAELLSAGARSKLAADPLSADRLILVIPVRCQTRGGRVDLATPDGDARLSRSRPDPVLIKGLRQSHRIAKAMGWDSRLGAFVNLKGVTPTSAYERNLVRLVFLAPDLQQRILEGRQMPGLTLARLMAGDVTP